MIARRAHPNGFILGLWMVCAVSLLGILLSLADAWQRPVHALTGIPLVSDTIDIETGRVIRAPGPKYRSVDLAIGDMIIAFGSVPWEQAQRLNMHERSDDAVGSQVGLDIRRDGRVLQRAIALTAPDAWEQLILLRGPITALLFWIPSAVLTALFSRNEPMLDVNRTTSLVYGSAVPLWVLASQAAAVVLSISSFKYPVAVLAAEALIPLLVAITALILFPYPLAPAALRPRFAYVLPALAVVFAVANLLHGLQSPFVAVDWRNQVQLPRATDRVWQATELFNLFGALIAIAGTTLCVVAPQLVRHTNTITERLPAAARRLGLAALQWIRATYTTCPPSIRVIAEVQISVFLAYVLLDLIPRAMFGVGNGFSALFAVIPLSYLLLYSDLQTQRLGTLLLRGLLAGVLLFETLNTLYKAFNRTYGNGANLVDQATLVLIVVGVMCGALYLTIQQWRRWSSATTPPVQAAIDILFTAESQPDFWRHLVGAVGPALGVETWMWLATSDLSNAGPGEWQIIAKTDNARDSWLADYRLRFELGAPALRPIVLRADMAIDLPSTLVVLPLYRSTTRQEALLAANPSSPRHGLHVDDPLVLSRLMQAVHALRSRERETQLAQLRQRLNAEQRHQRFRENHRFSALLHDRPLQCMPALVKGLREARENAAQPEQQQQLTTLEQMCLTLDRELRRIARELRPVGVGQRLRYSLEQAVVEWEQAHPRIRFEYEFSFNESRLDEYQRDSIFMIVDQVVENALKHAAPTTIAIRARMRDQHLLVEVRDNGRGFVYHPARVRPDALGILLRHDIAHDIGGQLTIITRPGAGCRVTLAVPYTEEGVHL
jgi:signal transduction histidine kinase